MRRWDINGKGTSTDDGSIEGTGANVVYMSTNKIPGFKTAKITVTLGDLPPSFKQLYRKGKPIFQTASPPTYKKTIPFFLVPDLSFQINLVFQWGRCRRIFLDNYYDSVSLRVDVKNGNVTIPVNEILNSPPTVQDTTGLGDDGSRANWVRDPYGEINIYAGSGTTATLGNSKQLGLQLTWFNENQSRTEMACFTVPLARILVS